MYEKLEDTNMFNLKDRQYKIREKRQKDKQFQRYVTMFVLCIMVGPAFSKTLPIYLRSLYIFDL
jgi:hypothetical protein